MAELNIKKINIYKIIYSLLESINILKIWTSCLPSEASYIVKSLSRNRHLRLQHKLNAQDRAGQEGHVLERYSDFERAETN